MGLLTAADRSRLLPLPGHALVGRAPGCALQISDRRVSSEHARIRWEGERWTVRDLGSTNGTWVADRLLRPGETVPLHTGSRLAFGDLELSFTLEDAGPPAPIASTPDGRLQPSSDGILALPDEESPEVLVFEDRTGCFVIERGGVCRPAVSGATVSVGGQGWTLHLPDTLDPTLEARREGLELSDVTLVFRVSADEERVALQVRHDSGAEEIPPRAHLYTLLTLARLRAAEHAHSEGEQGWVYADELSRVLAIDEMRLNVDVYRCRRDLGRLSIRGAAGVIERHRGTRQLRCGTARVAFESL